MSSFTQRWVTSHFLKWWSSCLAWPSSHLRLPWVQENNVYSNRRLAMDREDGSTEWAPPETTDHVKPPFSIRRVCRPGKVDNGWIWSSEWKYCHIINSNFPTILGLFVTNFDYTSRNSNLTHEGQNFAATGFMIGWNHMLRAESRFPLLLLSFKLGCMKLLQLKPILGRVWESWLAPLSVSATACSAEKTVRCWWRSFWTEIWLLLPLQMLTILVTFESFLI